jgi:hypothetical protein
MSKISLFISYCHEEQEYLTALKKYVNNKSCPDIIIWDDNKISPGDEWDSEIKNNIGKADIILLLISQAFLNSEYIDKIELKIAFERHARKECTVIPIFARNCDLSTSGQISALQGLPRDRKFLSDMGDEKYAQYTQIQKMINDLTDEIKTSRNVSESILKNDTKSKDAKIIEELEKNKYIFLSVPVSEEGLKKRKEFLYQVEGKIKYEQWPYMIIPGMALKYNSADTDEFQALIEPAISQSLYSIHIISSEKDFSDGINSMQYNLSKKNGATRFFHKTIIWFLTPGIKENLSAEIRRDIDQNPNIAGNDYEEIFRVIQSLDDEKEKKISELRKEFSSGKKVYILYDYARDHNNDLRIDLKTKIERHFPVIPSFPNENLTREKETLEKSHGAFIFYGDADSQWYMMRQSLLYDAQNLSSRAICLGDPGIETKIKRDVSINMFQTIKGQDELEAGITNFVQRLQK